MLWRPPTWSGPVTPVWRRHAALAAAAAAAEAAIGSWLRQIPSLGSPDAGSAWIWIAGLGAGLGLRVVLSWRRDFAREEAALQAGSHFHRRLWEHASDGTTVDGSWLAREGREWIEGGTRAAAELRTAVVTMVVLVPLLVWFAPWLAAAVVACGWGLGWVAQRRARIGKTVAEQETLQARAEADEEEWAWRANPEATASGLGRKLSSRSVARQSAHTDSRTRRAARLLAWGAIGETAAHAGGWILAAVALAAWKGGWLGSGDLAAFLGLALLAYRPVREAGRLMPQLQRAQRVWESLPAKSSASLAISEGTPFLEVSGLRAGWDSEVPVLRDVTFRAAPGDILAALGANGCGKSTLLAVLAGNCQIGEGSVSIPSPRTWMAQEPVLPPLPLRDWIPHPSPAVLALLFPQGLPPGIDMETPLTRG